MVQRRFVSMCTGIFFLLVFIFALCPAQPVHADTVDLLNWHDVAVYDGMLSAGFAVVPGFEDQLNSARLYGPADNFIYEFDLKADHFDDRTECSGGTYWWKEIDSSEFEVEDGTYTLILDFQTEEAKSAYTTDITTSSLEPEVTNLQSQVQDDGSINFSWDVGHDISSKDPFDYEIRIYNEDRKKCTQVVSYKPDESGYISEIETWHLRCLTLNESYSWQVRAFAHDSDEIYRFRSEEPLIYDPAELGNRIMWFSAADFNKSHDLAFDLRPGSRGNIKSAKVYSPTDDTPICSFYDKDFIDLSTATRLNTYWWQEYPDLQDGTTYDLQVTFTDGHSETKSFEYTSSDLKPVDIETMSTELDGHMVHVSFDSPADAPPQEYDLRIRSVDGTKEYFRSEMEDKPQFKFDPFSLFAFYPYNDALEPGKMYVLLVRAYDPENVWNIQDSQPKRFVYDPLGGIIQDPACISSVLTILLEDN